MAKSAKDIALDIDQFLKKKTLNMWSMTWAQLYEVASRERIKEAFQEDLRKALKAHNLEITYSINSIMIHRDAVFCPQKWE